MVLRGGTATEKVTYMPPPPRPAEHWAAEAPEAACLQKVARVAMCDITGYMGPSVPAAAGANELLRLRGTEACAKQAISLPSKPVNL